MRFKFCLDGILIAKEEIYIVDECDLQEALARVPKRDIVSIKQVKSEGKLGRALRKAGSFLSLLALYGLKPWSEERSVTANKAMSQMIETAAKSQPFLQSVNNGQSTSNASDQTLVAPRDLVNTSTNSQAGNVNCKCSVCEPPLGETATESQPPVQSTNNGRSTSNAGTQTQTTREESTDNPKTPESNNVVEHATQTTSPDVCSSSSDSDSVIKSRPKKEKTKQSAKKTRQTKPTLSARKVQFSETTQTRNIPLKDASIDSGNSESSGGSNTSGIDSYGQRDIEDSDRPRHRRTKRSTHHSQRFEEVPERATTKGVPPVRQSLNATNPNRSGDEKKRYGQNAVKPARKHGKPQPKPILKHSYEREAGHRSTSSSDFLGQATGSPILYDSKHRNAGSASSKSGVEAIFVVAPEPDLRGDRPGSKGVFARQPGRSPGQQNDSEVHGRKNSSHSKTAKRNRASNHESRHGSSYSGHHQGDTTVKW